MSKISLAISTVVVLAAGAVVAGAVVTTLPQPCEAPYAPGKASSLVTPALSSEGPVGASFPTPLKTTGRELSIVNEGSGEPARARGFVDFDLSVFLGSDGSYITGSGYEPANPVRRVIDPAGDDFFSVVLECALPDSQVVVTTTLEDVFGTIDEDDLLQNSSTIVLVIDVAATYPHKATGSQRLPESGLPTVVQTDDGAHGLSFPNAPIPSDLRVSVLKQGDGQAIAEGDFVTVLFTGVVWNTRQIFSTSFERGIPLSLIAIDSSTSPTGEGVIPGVAQALIGQSVGSQILVSVPPALGYPAGAAPVGISDNSTLVYVFDILGTSN
jgi:hypothetical protein